MGEGIEMIKTFIMESYGWSRDEVEKHRICRLLSIIEDKDKEYYDKVKKPLRLDGYII
jgi:hypothetical protein